MSPENQRPPTPLQLAKAAEIVKRYAETLEQSQERDKGSSRTLRPSDNSEARSAATVRR